jgi:hypothetical protein
VRRFSAAAFSAAAVLASFGNAGADSSTYTFGVGVDVVLTQSVSTETAHLGDTYYFKTAEEVKLGDIDLPAGTPGTGRLSTVVAATRSTPGQLALQADSLTAGTETIWVNIDTTVAPRGHYSSHRDLVLDPGMKFRVVSILPRKKEADLVTPPPANAPTSTNAMPGAPPSATSTPAP